MSVGGEGRRDSLPLFSVFRCWVVKIWMRLIRVDLRIVLSVLRRSIYLESCVDLSCRLAGRVGMGAEQRQLSLSWADANLGICAE